MGAGHAQHSIPNTAHSCMVLPPGEVNDTILELIVFSKSFMATVVTVSVFLQCRESTT